MKSSNFNDLYGKHFDFQPFANDFVSIESAGSSILVGFKNSRHEIVYEWLVSYPFDSNYDTPSKTECGCDLQILRRSQNEIEIGFKKEGYDHTLTLACTDQYVKPRPIKIIWE